MERHLEIRASEDQDRAAIERLYLRAFPDEDLLPVVRDLLRDPASTLSLVAVVQSAVVGNIIFTMCGVDSCAIKAALLAPLAVDQVSKVQCLFLRDCRDQTGTRQAVTRTFEWLAEAGEEQFLAQRARARAEIVRVIADQLRVR